MKHSLAPVALRLLVLRGDDALAETPGGSAAPGVAADVRRISLNGQWKFAADDQTWGED